MSTPTIERVSPRAGVRGGRVKVYCTDVDPQALDACCLVFGSEATRTTLATPTFLLGIVPAEASPSTLRIRQNAQTSNAVPFAVAALLAENLHPVANPAIDRRGNIYTTISGTKRQQIPASLYKVTPFGEAEPFVSGLANPTGLAFGPDDHLYVSCRHEGRIYRIDARGTASLFADRLGIATGLAFNAQRQLYVGDRRGTIYQVSETGEAQSFVKLGPSTAAYHLAFGGDERLYVSYPTLSGNDHIYAITPDGEISIVAMGLGRAQGLAFDSEHNLYVIAHLEGAGGVIKMTPEGDIQQVISGINLVGLAFGADGALILVDSSAVYTLDLEM